ncbi:DUF2892 domain-containing protein [Halobacteriales archaeon Cl-PHB]
MKTNVGKNDRLARLLIGTILAIVAVASWGGYLTLASGFLGAALLWTALVVGVVLVGTAFTGSCLIYSVLGISTASGGDGVEGEDVDEADRPGGRPA